MDTRHYLFGNLQYSAPPPPSARLSSLLTPIHPDQSRRMERISGSWEKHPYEMSTCSLQSNPAVKSTRNQKIPSSCSIFSSWNVLSLQQFHCRGKQRQSTSLSDRGHRTVFLRFLSSVTQFCLKCGSKSSQSFIFEKDRQAGSNEMVLKLFDHFDLQRALCQWDSSKLERNI